MRRRIVIWFFVSSVLDAAVASAEVGQPSRSFVINLDHLDLVKEAWQAGDPQATTEVNSLISWADRYLDVEPVSVVYSDIVAPSGDPHDYVDHAAYWWPNPDTPDGLPWIRRDGFVNPANLEDFRLLQKLSRWTESLSYAYYLTDDERYAETTANLLRTWFVSPETRMNPSNEFSQLKPGRTVGDYNVPGFGNRFPTIFDAAGIIESSAAWTAEDKQGMQSWARELVAWAKASFIADKQFRDPANHGTNYDFLHTLLSIYAEDYEEATRNARYYFEERMPGQIAADGSNPHEMQRANNLYYHRYNLWRAMDLAEMTRHLPEIDGLEFVTEDGRGLRLAIDFLLPYMTGEKTWDAWPGDPFETEPRIYHYLLRRAAVNYNDADLLAASDSVNVWRYGYSNITYPREAIDIFGDFDGDLQLTTKDIDLLIDEIRREPQSYDLTFDIDEDGIIAQSDLTAWVQDLKRSFLGDANLDGKFDSADLIQVMQSGLYEDDVEGNATWSSGDWNGDGEFGSKDLVAALQHGGYGHSSASVIPEPRSIVVPLLLGAAVGMMCRGRRRSVVQA